MFERRKDDTICPPSTSTSWKEVCAFITCLRYSPLHVTELEEKYEGKPIVGCRPNKLMDRERKCCKQDL